LLFFRSLFIYISAPPGPALDLDSLTPLHAFRERSIPPMPNPTQEAIVLAYRRTLSLPVPTFPAKPAVGTKSAAYQARSASVPFRFHPLVLQLDDDVADLRATVGRLAPSGSVAAVAEQLLRVLVSLSELLHHPQAQDPLRRLGRSPLAERLLDDFLLLADAHGSFRAAMVTLAALQAEVRAALRRSDPARLASAARAFRRSGRDLPRIASSASAVAPPPADLPPDAASAAVNEAAAVASAAVFSGVSSLSVAASTARVEAAPCWMTSPARFVTPSPTHHVVTTRSSSMPPRIWWVGDLMLWMSRAKRKSSAKKRHADNHGSTPATQPDATVVAMDPDEEEREVAFQHLDNLERCIVDVETRGEVFRALVNTRVFLLNILTNSSLLIHEMNEPRKLDLHCNFGLIL
jgi:hypothetical protein